MQNAPWDLFAMRRHNEHSSRLPRHAHRGAGDSTQLLMTLMLVFAALAGAARVLEVFLAHEHFGGNASIALLVAILAGRQSAIEIKAYLVSPPTPDADDEWP